MTEVETKQAPTLRWFVGRMESFEEVRRTVYEGDDFRNTTVAVFKTPEQARLAAAAPDLLAALKEFSAGYDRIPGPARDKMFADALAAIARAEGTR